MLLCFNSVFVSIGILLTYTLNLFFSWRFVGSFYIALSMITFLLIIMLPESPPWLITFNHKNKNQNLDALRSMHWIYRKKDVSSIQFYFSNYFNDIFTPTDCFSFLSSASRLQEAKSRIVAVRI